MDDDHYESLNPMFSQMEKKFKKSHISKELMIEVKKEAIRRLKVQSMREKSK